MTARSFSVVVPTLNEGAVLERTLAATARALSDAEVIVVDGGSTDETADVARACGAVVLRTPAGRGAQLDAGAQHASGDIIVLLHADTLLPEDAGAVIHAALGREGVVAGAFRLRFDEGGAPLSRGARWLERWLDVRARWFGIWAGDQAIFVPRRILGEIGGVPTVPLFEDVRLLRLLRQRGRVLLVNQFVRTSPRLFLRHGPWRVAIAHAALRALHAIGLPPTVLARLYGALTSPA